MDIYAQIKEFKLSQRLTNSDIGAVIGKTGEAFRMAVKRKSLNSLEVEKLEEHFGNKNNNVQEDEITYQKTSKIDVMNRLIEELTEDKKRLIKQNDYFIEVLDEYIKSLQSKELLKTVNQK